MNPQEADSAGTKESIAEDMARLQRVRLIAIDVFGSEEKAERWLQKSLAELGGRTPWATTKDEPGSSVVETILGKIAWGAAA